MGRFIKRPLVIEAVQYTGGEGAVPGVCQSVACQEAGNTAPHVHTIHANQLVNLAVGDWVVPEPDGVHFYPVKPDIFAAIYEPV